MKIARVLRWAIPACAIIYLGWFFVILLGWRGEDLTMAGTFGDSFGAINALFSAAALIAIAVSIFQAQTQISIQQDELKQNTAELKAQREEMEVQNRYLHKQAIQNQYFQMLESWQNIINTYIYTPLAMFIPHDKKRKATMLQGRVAINALENEVVDRVKHVTAADGKTRHENLELSLDSLYNDSRVRVGSYFNLLYQIIIFIDKCEGIADDDKFEYARILRSHLTESELILMFYGVSFLEAEVMGKLVKRYRLLKYMSYSPEQPEEAEMLSKMND